MGDDNDGDNRRDGGGDDDNDDDDKDVDKREEGEENVATGEIVAERRVLIPLKILFIFAFDGDNP